MNNKPKCCFLLCAKEAEWSIISGPTSDDVTEACTQHVGTLLTDALIHYVARICPRDKNECPN